MTEEKQELNEDLQAPEGQEELKQEEPKAPEVQEEDDYKAELDRVKQERDNYKEGLLKTKDKLKKQKETDAPSLDIDEIKESIRKDAVNDTIENVLDDISTNEDEKELIKHHYDRLQKTGFSKREIIQDLEDAKILANKKKIIDENKELKHSYLTRQSIGNTGAGSSVRKEYEPEPTLNPKEKAVMDRVNAGRVQRGQEPLSAKDFLGS